MCGKGQNEFKEKLLSHLNKRVEQLKSEIANINDTEDTRDFIWLRCEDIKVAVEAIRKAYVGEALSKEISDN